jgi:protein-L-isoaspartate(D-aspartate) O-methyltransferase
MPRSLESLAALIEREKLEDPRIAEEFWRLDRANFVPDTLRGEAYLDRPVALPFRQTTSQPSLIARMVDAAAVGPADRVLEIGTGYGFQTALLARLAGEVVSVERYRELAAGAQTNLAAAGIANAEVLVGNGWGGVPERAPFDAIVVSAAAMEVPQALVDQLAQGGRLVIPVTVGPSDDVLLFVKEGERLLRKKLVTPARFVPFVKRDPE